MQIFEFCCWKWTRNITLNCFGLIKLVLVGVMVMLIHFQQLLSKFQVLYVFFMILEIVDMNVHELMSLEDHRNYLQVVLPLVCIIHKVGL